MTSVHHLFISFVSFGGLLRQPKLTRVTRSIDSPRSACAVALRCSYQPHRQAGQTNDNIQTTFVVPCSVDQ